MTNKFTKSARNQLENIEMKKAFFVITLVLLNLTRVFAQQATALVNVNVIPMDRERVLSNQTVIVRDGVITEIGDAKKVKVPKEAQVIDARGKYLIPGLVDMHAHLLSDDHFPDSLAGDELKIMIANGVTTARLMIGTPEHLILRKQSADGQIIAPTLYVASPQIAGRAFGDHFNGYAAANEEQARDAVRRAKQDGYDYVKLTFFITRPVFDAVIDEARKQNMRVIGHVDRQVGLQKAFDAKMQIEHLDAYFEAMIPESAKLPGSTSGVFVWQPKAWESLDVLDEKLIPELARKTVEANPFTVPTLTFLKASFGTGQRDEQVFSRPGYKFYPPKLQKEMDEPRRKFWANPPSAERRAKYVDYRNKLTKAIHEAGGKVMTGTDSPEWLWLYGFTLHAEMQNLVAAGLSNYAALEAATRNPAEFFGTIKQTGTVEKGKKADLVLLDANPLENISATEKRAGVMLKGKWYPQFELNEWLENIEVAFQKAFDSEKSESISPQGFWEGAVTREGKSWRVNFEISTDGEGEKYKAVADFVDAGSADRPFTVEFKSPTLRLERKQPNGSAIVFDGKLNGDTISGKFSGIGTTADFTLRRAAVKPKFYSEEAVTFKNGDVVLAGTLLLPIGKTDAPAVVFAHGSALEARSTNKNWALAFVRRGFAALIYDKRGVGESTGETRSANLDDLAKDALAGVSFLKTRREINPRKIGVAGHSQGGTIAPLAAVKSKDVAFVISSAPSGVNYAEQSVYHRANVIREEGFSEEAARIASDLREKIYARGRLLFKGDTTAAEIERVKISAELEKHKNEPWFKSSLLPPNLDNDNPSRGGLELLYFEPAPMWEQVKIPVLVIWGDKDTVVPIEKGRTIIENALKKAGNKDYTIKIFPDVDHAGTIRPKNGEWDFPRVALSYNEATVDWLLERVRK